MEFPPLLKYEVWYEDEGLLKSFFDKMMFRDAAGPPKCPVNNPYCGHDFNWAETLYLTVWDQSKQLLIYKFFWFISQKFDFV